MGIFAKKTVETPSMKDNEDKSKPVINERPRICCIDISSDVTKQLISSGYNIYAGTLGKKIKVPNKHRNDQHQILLNFNFPENLHEYDIFIIDLNNSQTIEYNPEDHFRQNQTGKNAVVLLSVFPETIFDPRPLGSLILHSKLKQIGDRPHIILAFSSEAYDVEYDTVTINGGYAERGGTEKSNIYSFMQYVPLSNPKYGKEITTCKMRDDLKNLFLSVLPETVYNQTFHHPTIWKNHTNIPDPNYVPLLMNSSGDIVSICKKCENLIVLYLPQIKQKLTFLSEFLSKIAPDIFPTIFPFSTTFNWKCNEEYWLPYHKLLLDEKYAIEKEYNEKLLTKDKEISKNLQKFAFLHEMITETGDRLVSALINYLKWLGFKDVKDADIANSGNLLEEDIQVETEKGLLIIECKGIGGTSTDNDCSQIGKIKHRRCKTRNSFDVFAIYIVNHQRYLPPLQRQNPPFSDNQMQDAVNDERGLLTTWQLFNLYYEIEAGIIDKETARNALFKYGFIEFRPPNIVFIAEPKEIFKNGEVCIVNISELELRVGEELLVERNAKFQKIKIVGIQIGGNPVESAGNGEIGIQLSSPIKKKSLLWKKDSKK
jgi:hypothetical protein